MFHNCDADIPTYIDFRSLLKKMTITGETQDRERVLQHFSLRYYENNPTMFDSKGFMNF